MFFVIVPFGVFLFKCFTSALCECSFRSIHQRLLGMLFGSILQIFLRFFMSVSFVSCANDFFFFGHSFGCTLWLCFCELFCECPIANVPLRQLFGGQILSTRTARLHWLLACMRSGLICACGRRETGRIVGFEVLCRNRWKCFACFGEAGREGGWVGGG